MADPHAREPVREPLVCLHGLGGSVHAWDRVLPGLRARHDVRTVALRGHVGGEIFPVRVRPTVPALVDGVEAALDAAGIAQAHLVGNSLGGWLALELAARGRALSVVALSPAGGWLPDSDEVHRVWRLLVPAHDLARRTERHLDRAVRLAPARKALLRLGVEHGDRLEPAEAAAFLRDNARCRFLRPLLRSAIDYHFTVPAPDVPVRIAWSAQDRLLPAPRYAERFRALFPAAQRVRLPGVGHVPMYDDPALVVRTILEVTAPDAVPGRAGDPVPAHP
ncbi:alpha/beta fold hydrolase [Pseudonocardia halophobica]|uniref:Hydrolase n=1 Tax=Pseudonocardia halophobica TaxID=29401 RepID=A0A9W6NY32_9PSEU|nr:alpha/beta fold hydrolase [Pseudonocardia halophobica]GLL13348.1 hydrolase [Pseudonocardia halophobica]